MSHNLKSNRSKLAGARARRRSISIALAVISVALMSPVARSQKPVEDLPVGPMQGKAATSCLECHEARIILQQRLSKAAWTKEVDKMIKWGAVVDASDHDALVDYLSTNFSADQPAYEAPRTSIEKPAGKSSEKKSSK